MNDFHPNPSSQIPVVADSAAIEELYFEEETMAEVDCDCDCVEEC